MIDVDAFVQKIESLAGDPEAAHAAEDSLYVEVLTRIAAGDLTGNAARRACEVALKALSIDFERWYA